MCTSYDVNRLAAAVGLMTSSTTFCCVVADYSDCLIASSYLQTIIIVPMMSIWGKAGGFTSHSIQNRSFQRRSS